MANASGSRRWLPVGRSVWLFRYRLGTYYGESPGTENFLINRFGLRFDEVCASNLVTVNLEGKVIDRGTAESDEDINLTGFVIHSAVHAARTDVHCVMHGHSPGGIAVSALKDGLVPMTIDAMTFLRTYRLS